MQPKAQLEDLLEVQNDCSTRHVALLKASSNAQLRHQQSSLVAAQVQRSAARAAS